MEPHSYMSPIYQIRPSFMIAGADRVRLGAILLPNATPDQRDAALDFNLSCISSFGGCRAFCEIMPSIWREELRTYKHEMPPLVRDLLDNPKCPLD